MPSYKKHQHGTPNQIIMYEEEQALAVVKKSVATGNSQTIGRNGELPLIDFFNRYLPSTFKACSGHFISPSGNISPQIDIMIVDSRYPLLLHNLDGSVLVPLHAVIFTIEVKTNIRMRDIKKGWLDAIKICDLSKEIYADKSINGFESINCYLIAYETELTLNSLESSYEKNGLPSKSALDILILRCDELMRQSGKTMGIEFHFEPIFDNPEEEDWVTSYLSTARPSYTPLSDLYYRVIQDGYYTLGARGYDFTDIGRHVMDYMSWASCSWDDIFTQIPQYGQDEN